MLSCALSVLLSVSYNTASGEPQTVDITNSSCPTAAGFVPFMAMVETTSTASNSCVHLVIANASDSFTLIDKEMSSSADGHNHSVMLDTEYNTVPQSYALTVSATTCQGSANSTGTIELLGWGTSEAGNQP